jgi:RHS repeat-associated protein
MLFKLHRSRGEVSMARRFTLMLLVLTTMLGWSSRLQAQTEEIRYYHQDAVGSVRLVTDANGQIVERYDYQPFGVPVPASPAGTEARRFGGNELDPETGLDYVGARYYQSQLGRFTRPDNNGYSDPSNPQTLALYVYVYNNPLRHVDPTGHEGKCPPTVNFCIGVLAIDDSWWIWESLTRVQSWSIIGWDTNSWRAASRTMFCWEPYIDAQDKGYYHCFGEKVAGGATAPLATHTVGVGATKAAEHNARAIAGAYYHFTDRRFTAWGKYSKVMVPSLAPKIATAAKVLDVAGWAYFDYEIGHAIKECSELLQ